MKLEKSNRPWAVWNAYAAGCAALVSILLAGCSAVIDCASVPEGQHGVCLPDQPTCSGGPPEPVPDPRQDGATDITQFRRDEIPAGVVLSVPNEGRLHIADDAPPTYAADPPASGPHFDMPAPTGFYCEPLPPGHWVHSLEHGYVVVLFDDAGFGLWREWARFQLNTLLRIAPPSAEFGNVKLVITPYAGLPHRVCVVAWNRQLYLDWVDADAILRFYETYIDQGPERAP